jgi:preprotein translocase subunit SecE
LVERRTPNPRVGGSNPSWPAREHKRQSRAGFIKMNKAIAFLNEVRAELKKVTWPTQDELIGSAIIVCILVVVFAVILGCMDAVFTAFIKHVTRF